MKRPRFGVHHTGLPEDLHRALDDPAGPDVEAVRAVRDGIRALVEDLVAQIAPKTAA